MRRSIKATQAQLQSAKSEERTGPKKTKPTRSVAPYRNPQQQVRNTWYAAQWGNFWGFRGFQYPKAEVVAKGR
jgi:hypothetical protein